MVLYPAIQTTSCSIGLAYAVLHLSSSFFSRVLTVDNDTLPVKILICLSVKALAMLIFALPNGLSDSQTVKCGWRFIR
jgi:hypothetical protein